jgi:hypothetical protein
LAIFGRKSAPHQIPKRAAHAFFFEQVIGKMLEQIVGGGEENLLRAIPLSVAMDSHLKVTIAQLNRLSNPNWVPFNPRVTIGAARSFGNFLLVHIVVI